MGCARGAFAIIVVQLSYVMMVQAYQAMLTNLDVSLWLPSTTYHVH